MPTISDSIRYVNPSSTSSNLFVLNSLRPNTTYYYRAFSNTAYGLVYGEVMSFTTLAVPSVTIGTQVWMNKNLELYFSYYVNDFAGQFADAKAWRQSRKSKILNAQQLKIELSDIQFVNRNDDTVEVSFIQNYQSGSYKDSGRKLLYMKKIKGRWLVTQEVFK